MNGSKKIALTHQDYKEYDELWDKRMATVKEIDRITMELWARNNISYELWDNLRKVERRMMMEELKLYIGTKIIQAIEMDECTFLETFKGQDMSNRETRPGYRVVYPDGYTSWSPKDVFESAYREVTDSERELF